MMPINCPKKYFIYRETKRHRKLLEPGSGLDFIAKLWNARYRPRFWRKNPVMKLTREEEEIIRSFKKDNAFGTYFKGRKIKLSP